MLAFKALLFDLDGTLLDTAPDFIHAVNTQLALHDLEPLSDSIIRNHVTDGSMGLVQAAFGIDQSAPQLESLREELLALYLADIGRQTTLFDGMQTVLENCSEHAVPWGIVTNKPWKYTETLVEQLDPLKSATTIVCPDHVQQAKPSPEPILLACSKMSVRPEDCIFIGDHLRDIEAARCSGMRSIAAGWGYIDESHNIFDWNSDWVVEHPNLLNPMLFS